MTKDGSYKQDLTQFRLESAREMLRDAQLLNANVEPGKHSGVLAKFDQLFVRQGIFPKEMSRILHHAFDMRQAGDYQKSRIVTQKQASDVLKSAEEFVKIVEEKLR